MKRINISQKTFDNLVAKYIKIATDKPAQIVAFANHLNDVYGVANCTRVQFEARKQMLKK